MTGASLARSRICQSKVCHHQGFDGLTITLCTFSIYTCATNENIIYYCKDTFTADPLSDFIFDLAVMKICSLVELDTSTMQPLCEGNLVWVKIVPTGLAHYLVRLVSQYVFDRLRDIEQACVQ